MRTGRLFDTNQKAKTNRSPNVIRSTNNAAKSPALFAGIFGRLSHLISRGLYYLGKPITATLIFCLRLILEIISLSPRALLKTKLDSLTRHLSATLASRRFALKLPRFSSLPWNQANLHSRAWLVTLRSRLKQRQLHQGLSGLRNRFRPSITIYDSHQHVLNLLRRIYLRLTQEYGQVSDRISARLTMLAASLQTLTHRSLREFSSLKPTLSPIRKSLPSIPVSPPLTLRLNRARVLWLLSKVITTTTFPINLLLRLVKSLSRGVVSGASLLSSAARGMGRLWPITSLVNSYSWLDRLLNTPIRIYIPIGYLLSVATIIAFGYGSYWGYTHILSDLPDVTELSTIQPDLTTKIYDRNGILLYKIFKNENRSLVPLDQIPTYLVQATIAIEDQNFYEHPGFSIRGISRALRSNVSSDSLQGGSTITQQLVKNTLLTPERTWERKAKEVVLSFISEFYYSKDQILAMYLNQVPYGGSAYGVEEASQMYFGKSVREIDLAEAAFLAGLPASPTKYSPYGSNPQAAYVRQRQVIRRMIEDGYISAQEGDEALGRELTIVPPQSTLLAPHFVMYIRELLTDMYGPNIVENGGLEVTTSLDLALQNQAQQIVAQEVLDLSRLNVRNGAALITRPGNGEVLAMIGSINYFDASNDGQVNVTTRLRQPGSSIKPVTYAMALERGMTPATIIPDSPICYQSKGSPDYCPKNYDGRFRGRITLRQALAGSYNIPAVKTLAQFAVGDLIDKAEMMGITTWKDRSRFGLALTLGGGEVKMTDMAVAFGVFANEGYKVPLQPILEVRTADGQLLARKPCFDPITGLVTTCYRQQVLDPRVAFQISDILSDNQARTPAFGANSVLHIPEQEVAVKTGTTNSLRDNWTIGYTKDYLVAVWVGNNDNTQMSHIASGITGASPIWNKLMRSMLSDSNPHHFQVPTNLARVPICTLTGTLSCNGCPTREEYFIPGTEPLNHCSSEQIARILNPEEKPAE